MKTTVHHQKTLRICGEPVDESALLQIQNCLDTGADAGALMADHHQGYAVPIGGVVLYRNYVSPSGVGYDIACGNKAVRTNLTWQGLRFKLDRVMDEIYEKISFGVGRRNQEDVDHPLFDDDRWKLRPVRKWKDLARQQLGTVGAGNHYVDLFRELGTDYIWIGVHFGSRGLGHKTASAFVEAGGGRDGIHVDPVLFFDRSPLGEDYLQCMQLCGEYAYAGRDWVVQKVADILGARILEAVHNHHNFAWREEHEVDGTREEFWVVRKGATPAWPGQKSFIGGSMGDYSYIVEGVDTPLSQDLFRSTVHGAGRVMGRLQAKGKIKKDGTVVRPPRVTSEDMDLWVRKIWQVVLRGGDVDESPHVYKRIQEVLQFQGDSIILKHVLKPVGVAMAGPEIRDPHKD